MRKLLISIALMSSFAFACDSPYEEIQGVKIGCEFANKKDFSKGGESSIGSEFYSKSSNVKFFDAMEVEVDENNKVVGVAFVKTYPITLSNMKLQEERVISDYKMFVDSLEKRWGKFDKSKAKAIFSRINFSGALFMRDISEMSQNNDPKSDAIGKVFVLLDFKTNDKAMMQGESQDASFIIGYISKSIAEEIQQKKESITEGF